MRNSSYNANLTSVPLDQQFLYHLIILLKNFFNYLIFLKILL